MNRSPLCFPLVMSSGTPFKFTRFFRGANFNYTYIMIFLTFLFPKRTYRPVQKLIFIFWKTLYNTCKTYFKNAKIDHIMSNPKNGCTEVIVSCLLLNTRNWDKYGCCNISISQLLKIFVIPKINEVMNSWKLDLLMPTPS